MGFFHRQASRASSALATGLPAAAVAALTACAPSLAQTPPPTEPLVSSGDAGVVFTLSPPTAADAEEASVAGDGPAALREGDEPRDSRRRGDGGEYLYLAGIAGVGLALGGSGGGSAAGSEFSGGSPAGTSATFVTAGGGSGGSANRTATLPAGPDVANGSPGEVVLTSPAPGGADPGAPAPPSLHSLPQPAGGGGGSGEGAPGGGGSSSGSGGSGGLGDALFPGRTAPGGPQVSVQAVPEPGAVATVLTFGGVLGVALARGRRRRDTRHCG